MIGFRALATKSATILAGDSQGGYFRYWRIRSEMREDECRPIARGFWH
jgi:hypothetical protein